MRDTRECRAESPAEPDDRVGFEHSFFLTREGAYFRLSEHTGEPVFVINMGDGPKDEAVLPFPGIKSEFAIADDSADGRMMALVGAGLEFVKALRLGDPLPQEILSGEASWAVSDEQRQIAYSRLTIQLATWLTGDETLMTDASRLMQLVEDPKTKEKINSAFSEAADTLGFGRDGREKVIALIEGLAEELAHIEMLRGRVLEARTMVGKIHDLRGIYANEHGMLEIIDSVARLAQVALDDYQNLLDQVDAQTGEIMSVLKNIDMQVDFIRGIRDELFRKLNAWGDILTSWQGTDIRHSHENEELLRETYRFLAPRYMPVDEWVLMNKLEENLDEPKTQVVW